ncbi:MAG: GntR family transcriptional regulator [Ilumatobacteraceae bacterium]
MSVGEHHRPLRELVADEILGRILRGELQPGERLFEDRLAAELGVSRNPIRESIRALEATGLIEVIPRRGTYVAEIDRDDLCQLLDLRSVLEAYAAELAAHNRTDDDIAELDRCIRDGTEASRHDDLLRAASCHRDFHLAIETAARNPYIGATVGPLRHRTELVFSMLSDSRSMLSWDEHRRIRDAIADGDGERARQRATEHMAGVLDDLRQTAGPIAPVGR